MPFERTGLRHRLGLGIFRGQAFNQVQTVATNPLIRLAELMGHVVSGGLGQHQGKPLSVIREHRVLMQSSLLEQRLKPRQGEFVAVFSMDALAAFK